MPDMPVTKRDRPGYYFSVEPMLLASDGQRVELQVTHALELQSANSYPSLDTFEDPQGALQAGCLQLLGIHRAAGPLSRAHLYLVTVREGGSHEPIFELEVPRGSLICAKCGSTTKLKPAMTEKPADAGFEYDRKKHRVVYAERRQVSGIVCMHCRQASDIEECILGFDMTAAGLGIRFISVGEAKSADIP